MLPRKAYSTDLSNTEWEYIQPLIPPGKSAQGGRGRMRQVNIREVLNAIFYWADNGYKWDSIPPDLPPKSTVKVSSCLYRWS